MPSGILIAIEGIDGAGKTTQAAMLGDVLRANGEDVVESKEPTNGPWGLKIRESAATTRMPATEELHAFIEDRKQHIAELIQPSLDAGKIVILDRYFYSTIAYQGPRLDDCNVCELAEQMREYAPVPDAVLLLDVEPFIGLHRISHIRNETPNDFEKEGTLTENRRIFHELADCEGEPIVTIDGRADIKEVHRRIVSAVIDGPLKAKRCYKDYGCDGLHCGPAASGSCKWFELQRAMR